MKFFSAYERYVLAIMGGNRMSLLIIKQCKLHPRKPSKALHAPQTIKTNAATNIQDIVGGNLARNGIAVKATAATKVQAIIRSSLARNRIAVKATAATKKFKPLLQRRFG